MRLSSTPNPALSPSRQTSRRRRLAGFASAVLVAGLLPALLPSTATAAPPEDKAPQAAAGHWKKLSGKPTETRNGKPAEISADGAPTYALDRSSMESSLEEAPQENTAAADKDPLVVSLPAPDGSMQRFALQESSVMEAGLAAKHPDIKTYAGTGIDDPTARIRTDLTPAGFHASVLSPRGAWYIDPTYKQDQSVYTSYYARDLSAPEEAFEEREDVASTAEALHDGVAAEAVPVGPSVTLRTYRLALITDPSYATYHGAANVTAAKVTLINRVTQIYEDEMAVRLVLIADTDKTNLNTNALALEPNGPCGSSPCYTTNASGVSQLAGGCTGGLLTRNRIVLGQIIGASNYDVGHIGLGINGGGVASLNAVGGNAKAQGCTGLPNPIGDFFAVDYVAHEIGHQFGGNHTFNGVQTNCGGNKAAPSVEPGSGSSIMAYAGICRQDNLQPHSDPYWSQWSFQEITAYMTSIRPAINEVQNVSLRDFDGTDSFTLSFGGATTAPITRGVNYTTAGIDSAIEAITGAGTVAVTAWGATGTLNDFGFQVTFSQGGATPGPLAGTNVESLVLNAIGASGFVGETAKGGPIDNAGHTAVANGNHAPVVTAPESYTIPRRTPFALTGSATDSDGNATLTYMWEQKDRGGSGSGTSLVSNTKLNGPLFRQFGVAANVTPEGTLQTPSPGLNIVGTDPTRVFPDLPQILANNTNAVTGACPEPPPQPTTGNASNVPAATVDCFSEFLPTAAYVGFAGVNATPPSLNFRLTVRDGTPGGGGVGSDDTQLILAPATGPFLVTSQATNEALSSGSQQAVTWDVAGTDLPPVGTTDVKISLSTDGGYTYPHVLAETTANDGSATVTLPQIVAEKARVKVEAVGNVYFDISAVDFAIVDTTAPVVTVPANITVNAISPAGAPVSFSSSAVDAVDGPLTSVCTPASGSTFPIATTTVTCSATDAAGNTGSAAFTVTVRGAAAQLGDLIAASTGQAPGTALADKARAAAASLAAGSTAGACTHLAGYLDLVRAQTGKKIPAATAAALTADATRIRAVLAC